MENNQWLSAENTGAFLLDAALALLRSGASSDRIRTNVQRLASGSNAVPHISIMPLSISISLHEANGTIAYSGTGSISAQGVNFQVISGISHISWDVANGICDLEQAKKQLAGCTALPHYNRWLLLIMVGMAGAAFCFTFGGSITEMAIGFAATIAGLFCKQEMVKRQYNVYIITFISALVAATTVGLFKLLLPHTMLEHAFSTCVLFLIPGVPLINAITDLIEGYTLNGIARGVGALIHAMAIAFGLVITLYFFGYV